MSILVEIAARADVPLEGVVRVLTREPVNSTVKVRVLAVLDQLDAEQTRVLERFALAAIYDVAPLEPEGDSDGARATSTTPGARPPVHEGQLALGEPPAANGAPGAHRGDGPSEPDPPVGLGTLLEELVSAVWEIRHEARSDRQERLDDLAVLVDLMTTSWQGVDRRLGELEQLVARTEAHGRMTAPGTQSCERSIRQSVLEAVPPPTPPPAAADLLPEKRGWPPFAGTLLLVVGLIGALLALDHLPSRSDGPRFLPAAGNDPATLPARESGAGTVQTGASPSRATRAGTTRASTREPTTPPGPTTPPASSAAPRTTRTAPRVRPARAPAATAPRQTSTRAARQTAPPPPTAPAGESSTIQPARVFVWPRVQGIDAYSVRFFRAGQLFYEARVSEPRLALPKWVKWAPGAYRWVVRPVTGTGSKGLGSPIIDSSFSVAKS